MISILRILLSIVKRVFGVKPRIILVRRMPPTRTLRAQILGLTLGTVLAFAILFLDGPTILSGTLWYAIFILVFAIGTATGGAFVALSAVLYFIPYSAPATPTPFAAFHYLAKWYFFGYAFGAVLALLYNDLVYLYLLIFEKKFIKIAFAYDRSKAFNVIKSPIAEEEKAFAELPETASEHRLYDYELSHAPKHPYTIAFVANAKILKKPKSPAGEEVYEKDPIIDDLRLFLFNVDRALFSLERNEVTGRPDIWSRVRVITIFDSELKTKPNPEACLAQEYQQDFEISGETIDNLIDTGPHMASRFKEIFERTRQQSGYNSIPIEEVDVIYVLTASPSHDRSTARYSDFVETDHGEVALDAVSPSAMPGKPFDFSPDPDGSKGSEIVKTPCPKTDDRCKHEYYTWQPGRIALNVLSARTKTYVHEFAHAMSSAIHGAIVDEYADVFHIAKKTGKLPDLFDYTPPYYINRIARSPKEDGSFIPVHSIFAKYNGRIFYSDRNHPSAEEGWLGYFPEKFCCSVPCTMDRSFGRYHFDKLISTFMYERICAKLNRPDHP